MLLGKRVAHSVALYDQAVNIEQREQTIANLGCDRFGPPS